MISKFIIASLLIVGAGTARAQAAPHPRMTMQMPATAHDSACAEVHAVLQQQLDSASMQTIHAALQASVAAGLPADSVHHVLMHTLLSADALHALHVQLDSAQMAALHTCMAGMLDDQKTRLR